MAMWTRQTGTILRGAAGVLLLWIGLDWLGGGVGLWRAPLRAAPVLAGLAAVVGGEWLCWLALARHVRPPAPAERVVAIGALAALGVLALTAAMVWIVQGIC